LLDVANSRRRAHARLYDELLGDTEEIVTPLVAPHRQHVYHIYAVRVKHRDRVLREMAAKGIACAIHYPIPVHLQEAYRGLGYGKGSFPVAERCAEQFLSLPMYPELTSDQIRTAAEQLRACVQSRIPQECVA
jgi:dTDP-4-amino-4,6-dideoxygalactose transaminase